MSARPIIYALFVAGMGFIAWRVSQQKGNLVKRINQTATEILSVPDKINAVVSPVIVAGFNVRPILDLIARAEANHGYDSYYSGSRIRPQIPISRMTLQQVRDFQIRNKDAGSVSTAVGRYQFIADTLQELSANDNPLITIFNPALQDEYAVRLLQKQGLAAFRSGLLSAEAFAAALARVWAGLPRGPDGISYYAGVAGNRARVAWDSVLNALRG